LHSGVRSITDLMCWPGLINLRLRRRAYGDDRDGQGDDGTGEATGGRSRADGLPERHRNPLLDEVSLRAPRRVLVNVTGGAGT